MQYFYEYSFSTAAIGADTQLAQSFEVLQNTCSSAKTARFDKEKITPGRERFRGDSDKTPPSRDSRSQEGNDEKLQQQDCHITVYHSES